MSAYRTANDLITEALANLGVLAAGQPTDPEDFSYVSEKLPSIFRKIAALEIVSLQDQDNLNPNTATIPSAYFSDLADIIAGECCTKFGVTADDYMKLINRGLGGVQGVDVGFGAAAKSLRAILRGRPTGEVLRIDYF
jgi:hypothetical protein